jgi:hypothetical protein
MKGETMPATADIPTQVARKLAPIKIGPAIDKLYELREAKRKLNEQIEKIEADYADVEEQLMAKLEAEGTNKGTGAKATCSITHNVVGNVTDWDKVHAFIKKTGYTHLYRKQLNDASVRELFEAGKKVPGCEPFTKKRLNLRVASGV